MGNQDFESLGEFVAAVALGREDPRLGVSAMQLRDGKRGGFAVPEAFRAELLSTKKQDAIVRPRAEAVGSGSDAAKPWPVLLDDGKPDKYRGARITFVSEGTKVDPSELDLRSVSTQPRKAMALIPISNELLRNWRECGARIADHLRSARAAFEDDKFLNGSGVTGPLGVLNSPALLKQSRAAAGKIGCADLYGMLSKAKLSPNSVWVAHQSTLPQLMQVRDDEGIRLWAPAAREGEPMTLIGMPLLFNDRSPMVGAKGDVALCDFGAYQIDDGTGPFIDVSEHPRFETDETLLRMVFNVDGQPIPDAPIVGPDGYTVSPFVALDA